MIKVKNKNIIYGKTTWEWIDLVEKQYFQHGCPKGMFGGPSKGPKRGGLFMSKSFCIILSKAGGIIHGNELMFSWA